MIPDPYKGYIPPAEPYGVDATSDSSSEKDRVDRIWEVFDGLDEDSIPSMRFCAMMRLSELNVAMRDLWSGPCIFRDDGKEGMIELDEDSAAELRLAVNHFFERYDEYGIDTLMMGDAVLWGDDVHIANLAKQRAASDRLRHLLGDVLCERIEVLGKARENLHNFFDGLWLLEWAGEESSEDFSAEENFEKRRREEDLEYLDAWASGKVSDDLLDEAHVTFLKSHQKGGDDSDKEEIEDSEEEMDTNEAYLKAWLNGDIQDELLKLAFTKWNERQEGGSESPDSDFADGSLDRERKAVDEEQEKEDDDDGKAQRWNDSDSVAAGEEELAALATLAAANNKAIAQWPKASP